MTYILLEYRSDYVILQHIDTLETRAISYDLLGLYAKQGLLG